MTYINKTYLRWRERKDAINALHGGTQYQNNSPFFWWRLSNANQLNFVHFSIDTSLYNLPIELEVEGQYKNEDFKINDLQCPYQTLGLDSCRHKNDKSSKKCWCGTIDNLRKNGTACVVFQLYNFSKYPEHKDDIFYIWVAAKMNPQKGKFAVTLDVEFKNTSNMRNPYNIIEIFNTKNIRETTTLNESLITTNIQHISFNGLPKNIISNYYSSKLYVPKKVLCNYGNNCIVNKVECPNDGVCFCSLMNQIRSEGIANINFPLEEYRDNKLFTSDFRMKLYAIRDPKNHEIVTIHISYDYDHRPTYHYPAKNTTNHVNNNVNNTVNDVGGYNAINNVGGYNTHYDD